MNFKSTNKVINAISECEKYEANTSKAIYLQGLRTREKKNQTILYLSDVHL